jgi:hypothetical protein
MTGKMIFVLGIVLLALVLAACGTIEVSVADDDGRESSIIEEESGQAIVTSPQPTATASETTASKTTVPETTTAEATATAEVPSPTPEEMETSTAGAQSAPAGWQRFYDAEYGIELWHPPGTIAEIGEPARPEFSSVEHPEGIVEEQLFVVRVIHEEGGALGPPGPQAILEVKLVANTEGKRVGEVAELYSRRCPGELHSLPQATTINVHLSGYRYDCEGMMVFTEFWSPYPADPQIVFGAAWSDMSAPFSDEILATVAYIE